MSRSPVRDVFESVREELDYRWFQLRDMLKASSCAAKIGASILSGAHVVEQQTHLVSGDITPATVGMGILLVAKATSYLPDMRPAAMREEHQQPDAVLSGSEHILGAAGVASEELIC